MTLDIIHTITLPLSPHFIGTEESQEISAKRCVSAIALYLSVLFTEDGHFAAGFDRRGPGTGITEPWLLYNCSQHTPGSRVRRVETGSLHPQSQLALFLYLCI